MAEVKLPLFALLDTRPLMLDAGVADDDDLDVTATAPEEAAGTAQKKKLRRKKKKQLLAHTEQSRAQASS